MSELRLKISNEVFEWMVRNHEINCSTVEFDFLADKILSLIDSSPTEWGEVVRKCDSWSYRPHKPGAITDCPKCNGIGEIVRPLTRGEALRIFEGILSEVSDVASVSADIKGAFLQRIIITLPSDEHVRVKK